MQSTMLKAIVEDFGNGGTIDGDLVVSGDLQVSGGGSLSFDEIVQGTQVVEITNTEAFLVRKASDGGDVLTIDTTNSLMKLGKNGGTPAGLNIYGATNGNPLLIYEDTDNSVVLNFYLDSSDNAGLGLYANGASQKVNLGTVSSSPTYFTGGNVGIGTASPAYTLTAEKSVTGDWLSRIYNTATSGNPSGLLVRVDDPDSTGILFGANANGSYRFVVKPDGATGIGTSSPAEALHISSSEASATPVILLENTNANNLAPQLNLYNNSASPADGDFVGQIDFEGNDSGGNRTQYARIIAESIDVTNGLEDGILDLNVMYNSTLTNGIRLRGMDGGAFVGIGESNPEANLHISNSSGAGHLILETTSASHGVMLDLRGSADRDAEIIFREGSNAKAIIFNDASNNSLSLSDGSGGLSPVLNIKSGSVGIGTASPTSTRKMTIQEATSQSSAIHFTDTDTMSQGIVGNARAVDDIVSGTANNDFVVGSTYNKPTHIITNNTIKATIDSSGNVGIGASPSAVLHLFRNSTDASLLVECTHSLSSAYVDLRSATDRDSTLMFREGSTLKAQVLHDASEDSLVLTDGANSNTVFIKSDKVGIGISPVASQKLHVNVASNVNFTTSANSSTLRLNAVNDVVDATIPLEINSTNTQFLSDVSIGTTANYGNLTVGGTGELIAGRASSGAGSFSMYESGTTRFVIESLNGSNGMAFKTPSTARMILDDNSRISLSNNDSGGTGGRDSTSSNTLFGWNAGANIDAGSVVNTFIGHASGSGSLDDAQNNVGVGAETLQALTTGDSNTVMGAYSAFALTTGQDNVFIGTDTGFNCTDGDNNTVVGRSAGAGLTSGSNNTIIGRLTADAITTGNSNIVIGDSALGTATTATLNVAIGGDCMSLVPASVAIQDVVAIGQNAFKGSSSTTDDANGTVAIGRDSLKSLTVGAGNVAIGYETAKSATISGNSVLIGYQAGAMGTHDITGGSNNVLIGYKTKIHNSNGNNQVVIGKSAEGQGDNTVVLGNTSVTDVYASQDGGAFLHATGIKFPATQNASSNANALDDYEEGTWTPVFCNLSATGQEMTMNGEQAGTYVKIGRLVHVSINAGASGNGSATNSDMAIKNLPFACGGSSTTDRGFRASFHVSSGGGLNLPDGNFLVGFLNADTQVIELRKVDAVNGTDSGNTSQVSRDEISTDGGFIMSGTYIADA